MDQHPCFQTSSFGGAKPPKTDTNLLKVSMAHVDINNQVGDILSRAAEFGSASLGHKLQKRANALALLSKEITARAI